MNMDYFTLGTTPADEDCAQVGAPDYQSASLREAARWIKCLKRLFPTRVFGIKKFPHDFGSYHEVCVFFDADDLEPDPELLNIESYLPMTWEEAEDDSD